jgi:hypothetical protein
MSISEEHCQAIGPRRYDNEMHMIGHQTVGPDLYTRSGFSRSQQRDVCCVIARRKEGLLPSVTALCHMVRMVRNDESRYARHLIAPSEVEALSLRGTNDVENPLI